MSQRKEMEKLLREKGEGLLIPRGLEPEQMKKTLEERVEVRKQKRRARRKRLYPAVAAAAVFCLMAGAMLRGRLPETAGPGTELAQSEGGKGRAVQPAAVPEEEQELLEPSGMSYEEIYACLSAGWQSQASRMTTGAPKAEAAEMEDSAFAAVADLEQKQAENNTAYGRTNVQTEQVDETDRIKNDGRYLYQIARKPEGEGSGREQVGIQILDTEGGLKETAFLTGFENLEEFYLWNDLIIAIENKYYDTGVRNLSSKKGAMEDGLVCGVGGGERGYHEITVYEAADKSHPRKLKTFTLQGICMTSRVADGYFYGISCFAADPGEGESDYDAYIPSLEGKRLEPDQIYCPPDADSTDYLVLVSIDLSDPTSFADSRAVLGGSDLCYVSRKNIYMAWNESVYQTEPRTEGKVQDRTRILRFSYGKGKFYGQASGEIPGRLEGSFSLDEYDGHLRAVTTVKEYQARKVTDDRTGETLGYDYVEEKESNALYVLGLDLTVKGKIEGLAENEFIRSARFQGETGYFVTFRQTDPLFAADLSDPEHPEILGELKVSGFSEYLHVYGEDLLLGIGMEADEETGVEEGMKLSMFDVSDPADPKEVTRLLLKDYNYSEALYDHRAVLIDPAENILGFEAEGSRKGEYRKHYLFFSYEDGSFVQTLKADTGQKEGAEYRGYYRSRGTFIGDTCYLLLENGGAQAYSRATGELLSEL